MTGMDETVIRAENVSKRYRIVRGQSYNTLREAITSGVRTWVHRAKKSPTSPRSSNQFWALNSVSFEVKRGEVLGIIGRNGAGKSTLLKVLSRITEPTTGRIELDGRVGSLLEVGTGFHPELTGRENVYLNGAVLGMKRDEINHRFDEIIAFAGVEEFVDTPVKHYSSGMYLRLAFAVAAHLDTELLLVDEVLAVGDAAFQLKCLNKMSDISESGRTIIYVSHNMESVTNLCSRALLLNDGAVAHFGSPQECIEEYLAIAKDRSFNEGYAVSLKEHSGRTKFHNGPVRLSSLSILDSDGRPAVIAKGGEQFTVAIGYEVPERKPHSAMFSLTFSNFYNHRIASCRSHDTLLEPIHVDASGIAICRIPKLPLVPGYYRLTVGCNTEAGQSDGVYDALIFEVVGTGFYASGLVPNRAHGEVLFEHSWQIQTERPVGAVTESLKV